MPRAASPCSNRLPPRAASGLAKPPSAAKDGDASDAPSIRLLATIIRDSTRFMKTSITDDWLDDTWVRQPEPASNVSAPSPFGPRQIHSRRYKALDFTRKLEIG